jgi:hypothetical protein
VHEIEWVDDNEIIKNKPKKSIFSYIKIIFIIVVILFIGGTFIKWMYQSTKTINVDNPSWSGITIQFNNQEEIFIDAYTTRNLKLDNWEHSLKVNNLDMWLFIKEWVGNKNFLNPTNEIYIQEYILYWDENNYDKLPNNLIEAYWNEAEGPFKKYEGIYINWDWNYDISEQYPEEVTMRQSQTYKIKSKLYRFDDFADMYNRDYITEYIEETPVLDTVK